MKNKQLWLSLAFVTIMLVWASFTISYQILLFSLGIGLIIAIPIRLVHGYLIPNQWVFEHHKWIFSLYFGLMIWTLNFININSSKAPFYFHFGLLLFLFFLTFILFYIAEKVEKRYQNTKLADLLVPAEDRVLIDRGYSIEESGKQQGLVILSSEKLTFIYNDKIIEPKVIDIQTESMAISNFLASPAGIRTSDANIRMAFPRLWMKKIAELKRWICWCFR